MKQCQRCQLNKSLEEFSVNNSKKDGKEIYCKTCLREKRKTSYNLHRTERIEARKKYVELHKNDPEYIEKKRQYNKKYHLKYHLKQGAWRPERRDERLKLRREWRTKRHLQNPAIYLLEASKYRARKKGLEHNITLEDVVIPSTCPILGIPIVVGDKKQTDNSPSIDRIDNSKGYVKGNIVVVSWKANDLKGRATIDELEKIVHFYKKL